MFLELFLELTHESAEIDTALLNPRTTSLKNLSCSGNLTRFSQTNMRRTSNILIEIILNDFIKTLKPFKTLHDSSLTKCNLLWIAYGSMSLNTELNNLVKNAKYFLTFVTLGKFIEMISENLVECNNILKERFNQPFRGYEITYLKEFGSCLAIFAVNQLEKKSAFSVAYIFPVLYTIRHRLQTLSGTEMTYLKHAPCILIQRLDKNLSGFYSFSDETHHLISATCMFPKLKLTWLPDAKDLTTYNKIRSIFVTRIETIAKDDKSQDDYFTFDRQWATIEKSRKIEFESLKYLTTPKAKYLDEIKESQILTEAFLLPDSGSGMSTPVKNILNNI